MSSFLVGHIDGKNLNAALVDNAGKIVARQCLTCDISSAANVADKITQTRLLAKARHLAGLALAYPGKGEIASFDGPTQKSLTRRLERKLAIPVLLECESRAAILGETWLGTARGKRDVALLRVAADVSGAVISNGQLLRGLHGLALNVAWMAVSEADGDEIRRYGGLQALASASALVHAARNAVEAGFGGSLTLIPPDKLDLDAIAKAARQRDPIARQLFQRVGRLLGLAVANLINLFDPEVVIVSGAFIAASDLFFDDLKVTALGRCHPLLKAKARIRMSKLNNDAILLGLARLLLDNQGAGKRHRA